MSHSRATVEAASRRGSRFAYIGDNTILATVLDRYRMVLDSTDRGIVPHLCMDGFWESWITAWVMNNVKAGQRVLNLGANCGYYTMLLADLVGPAGRVLAVEPSPVHAANIWYSAHLNGYHERLDLFEGVVGEQEGPAVLSWYPGMTMNARVYYEDAPKDPAVALSAPKETMTAQMKRADVLVAEWPSADLALIDTEGAEPMVFKGMEEIIKHNPRFRALIEFSPGRYADPASFIDWLRARGFGFEVVGLEATASPITREQLLDGEERMILLSRP